MLKFVYFKILLQFCTYIYYDDNLCWIYRDKYLTVRKISKRSTQKNQIRTDVTWCCSSPSHKLSSTSESTLPSISISSLDRFGGVGLGLPHTRSHKTSISFSLAGVAPSALTFFQLIISSGQQHTTCPLLLIQARLVAHWYAASCPCTIVCYFFTHLLDLPV